MSLSELSNSEFVPLTQKVRAELQAKRDIMEAILASSPEHLEKVIQCSPDDIINCPYLSVSHPKEYNEFGAFKEFKDGGEKDFGEEDMIALQEDSFTFPLRNMCLPCNSKRWVLPSPFETSSESYRCFDFSWCNGFPGNWCTLCTQLSRL